MRVGGGIDKHDHHGFFPELKGSLFDLAVLVQLALFIRERKFSAERLE